MQLHSRPSPSLPDLALLWEILSEPDFGPLLLVLVLWGESKGAIIWHLGCGSRVAGQI